MSTGTKQKFAATNEQFHETDDGLFFLPFDSREPDYLGQLRELALEEVERLREIGGKTLRLANYLGFMKSILLTSSDDLAITIPNSLVRYTRAENLIADYRMPSGITDGESLLIPRSKITGVIALPYAQKLDPDSPRLNCEPNFALRIETTQDPLPTAVYQLPGTTPEQQSCGARWHNFPVDTVTMTLASAL